MADYLPDFRILRRSKMKVIYVVTCALCNKYAFVSKKKAEEFAETVEGIVDVVPFDASTGYDELGGGADE